MNWLSDEEVTMPKYQFTSAIFIMLIAGMGLSYLGNKSGVISTAQTITVHDTTVVENNEQQWMQRILLFTLYKAGWRDASNELIDLNNENKFNDENIKRVSDEGWIKKRKWIMESK